MKNKSIALVAFSILSLLWLGFLIVLFANQQLLVSAWQVFTGWPLIFQIVVWLLALPLVLGLWIWQMAWAMWLRVILVLGLALVSVYLFFPKKNAHQPVSLPNKS